MIIDNEFKLLIPALHQDEFQQLEENILKDGIRDPLIVWGETLIDGHNRYEIAQKHSLQYKTISYEFNTRNDVIIWIIKNQFGRRNLSSYDRSKLALKLKPVIAEKAKENQEQGVNQYSLCQKSDKPIIEKIDTKKELAKIANVSHDTINKVEKIEKKAIEPIKQMVKNETISINQAEKIAKLEPEQQEKILPKIEKGLTVEKIFEQEKSEEKARILEERKQEILEQTKQEIKEIKPIVYNEDCKDFLKKYDLKSVNLLLTDPPYSTDVENIIDFVSSWYYEALSKVREDGRAYIFIGAYPKEVSAYLNAKIPEWLELKQILVWSYKNTLGVSPKDRYNLNYQNCLYVVGKNAPDLNCPLTSEQWAVQEINAPDGRLGDRYHKWQKPLEIAERFIRHSTKEGDIVIDPFCCTGTHLIAACKLKRKAFGCDIDSENLKIAIKRGCSNG